MSIAAFILGESGTGKSTSMRNLDPKETLLVQSLPKPLPFRNKWTAASRENSSGNIFVCDDTAKIIAAMQRTSRSIIVIDDFQYVMANEFMRRNDERGFDKFNDIGRHAWDVLNAATKLPAHVRVYILSHTQNDESGRVKAKTIGKMLDEKITIEGMFSIVMRTTVIDGQYLFTTQNNGFDTVKTPMGMFADATIENDLAQVDAAIVEYYNLTETLEQ